MSSRALHLVNVLSRLLPEINRDFSLSTIKQDQSKECVSLITIHHPLWIDFFVSQHSDSLSSPHPYNDWLWTLNRQQARSLLAGQSAACRFNHSKQHLIIVPTAQMRDDVVRLCFHAGFTSHFSSSLDSPSSMAQGETTITNHKAWKIFFSDSDDVVKPILSPETDLCVSYMHGRVWCVTVPPYHLVVTRKALLDTSGTVSEASCTVIVGQCKFMHDRGDYKSGWQLEKEWEDQQRLKRKQLSSISSSSSASSALDEENFEINPDQLNEDGDLPWACFICRNDFVDPVVTL